MHEIVKRAIEQLKAVGKDYDFHQNALINVVTDLLEKQQKQIEELTLLAAPLKNYEGHIEKLEKQLVAGQAREAQMATIIKKLIDATPGRAGRCSGMKCREPYCYSCNDEEQADSYLQSVFDLCHEANSSISQPADDTALREMIKKAGEVMRGKTINELETYRIPVGNSPAGELACEWTYDALMDIRDEIRDLPVVTLEDLKGEAE